MSKPTVTVETFDTTLRDGAQAVPEANQLADDSKPEVANLLALNGIGVIEAGFPVTKADTHRVRSVAETVGNTAYEVQSWITGVLQGSDWRSPLNSCLNACYSC